MHVTITPVSSTSIARTVATDNPRQRDGATWLRQTVPEINPTTIVDTETEFRETVVFRECILC